MAKQTSVRIDDLFRSTPKQELGQDVVEQAGGVMHQEASDFQIRIDIMKSGYGVGRFNHEGQAGVNYPETQIGKMDRGAIDVVDPVRVDRHRSIGNRLV